VTAAAPRANPFDVSAEYAVAMRLALGLALLPGLAVGLVLVVGAGLGLPLIAAWPQLAQAHGQVQALGFVPLFVVAVGLQLFPRFFGTPPLHTERVPWGAAALALALLARLVGQPLAPGPGRTALLGAAAVAAPLGLLAAGSAFHGLARRSVQPSHGPAAAWRRFVAVGGLALGGSLLLYLGSGLELAAGAVLVPAGVGEALVYLELAGFGVCLVLGVGSRIFGRLLLLRTRPTLERSLPGLAGLWAAGLVLVAGGWLLATDWAAWVRLVGAVLQLAVLCAWLWLVGLYEAPSRQAANPHVVGPTRRWVRTAFLFLVVGVAFSAYLFGREALLGAAPSSTELSAARHAIGQGFLLPVMATMAARLLPVYSADALRHRARLEVTVDLLLAGAALRVVAEALGGYGPLAGPVVALGGALTLGGFGLFAGAMWSALGRLPRLSPGRPAGA
jgi:hypothetical protein